MSEVIIQSAARLLQVFECLCEEGFKGKTALEITEQTNISMPTVWRALKTLEAYGWVVEVPVSGSKQVLWRVSDKLVGLAFQYRRHALGQVHEIERRYLNISGEVLRND